MISEEAGIRKVLGVCLKDNAASKRVLQKCGFEKTYEGPGDYQGEEREIFRSLWKRPER
jgi:RimJ/RimL family protein N-acetyltransferase